MGLHSSKIYIYNLNEDVYSIGLSQNQFNDIKQATSSLNLSDIRLIRSIRYLKNWGINLTDTNTHLWRVYINWGSNHIIDK